MEDTRPHGIYSDIGLPCSGVVFRRIPLLRWAWQSRLLVRLHHTRIARMTPSHLARAAISSDTLLTLDFILSPIQTSTYVSILQLRHALLSLSHTSDGRVDIFHLSC